MKTQPKPPSPRYELELKFLVAVLRSFKLKDFRLTVAAASLLNYEKGLRKPVEIILDELFEIKLLRMDCGFSGDYM